MALTSNEALGTAARLGVARLGATRLGALVDANNLDPSNDGTYAWKRKDAGVKHADPPTSVENAWTVGRS